MACFTAPLLEAIVVSAVKKKIEKKEKSAMSGNADFEAAGNISAIPFSRKLGWLSKLLWGGSFLLAVEHIWHGEIVPWPPFLTAMNNPADIAPMLLEIATVGAAMMVFVTAVWGVMVLISNRIEKKALKTAVRETTEA